MKIDVKEEDKVIIDSKLSGPGVKSSLFLARKITETR